MPWFEVEETVRERYRRTYLVEADSEGDVYRKIDDEPDPPHIIHDGRDECFPDVDVESIKPRPDIESDKRGMPRPIKQDADGQTTLAMDSAEP